MKCNVNCYISFERKIGNGERELFKLIQRGKI